MIRRRILGRRTVARPGAAVDVTRDARETRRGAARARAA